MVILFLASLLSIGASQIRFGGVPISQARFSRNLGHRAGRIPTKVPIVSSIRIPVDISDSGRVSVNATINDEERSVSMTVTGQDCLARIETDDAESEVTLSIPSFDSASINFDSDTYSVHQISASGSWFTTGPRSRLVRAFDSVGMVKNGNSGLLVLGGDRAEFSDNFCTSNTSFLIPFNRNQRRIFLYLGNELIGQYNSIKFYDGIINPTAMIMIPSPVAVALEERLVLTGATRVMRTFGNCTELSLEGVADIRIEFETTSSGVADAIVFTPIDYFWVNDELRTCTPRYIHTYVSTDELIMNPYAMPEINFRITQSSLELCDAV